MEIPVFVVNLDRAPERLAHATAALAEQGLAFVRISAVDGSTLADGEISRVHDAARARAAYHVPMQRGEIACFLSHRRAWETFLGQSAAPYAVILEDDFELCGALAPVVAAVQKSPAPSWDVIKLWGKQKRWVRSVVELTPEYELVRESVISKRTIGQFVSRRGAETLLARTLPIVRPIDVQLQYPWELGIDVFTIRPSILIDVGEELFGLSTTKALRDADAGEKFRREARRLWLQVDLTARSLERFVR